jgi:cyclomaltodextrinase
MKSTWADNAFFYHIFPLGLTGGPEQNDLSKPDINRIDQLYPWLDHMQKLGANALFLGPVFQSTSHGYDIVDYYRIDRRLGDNDSFARFADTVHSRGMQLVLDAVFNHVGRDFWAFKDVLVHGDRSAYVDWFYNLRFGEQSPLGDPFTYEGWSGHYGLVKLNLSNQHVRDHLFDAVRMWMSRFGIDGLRLDAADCLDFDFLRALRGITKQQQSDFWLMGEVVHGDYRQWANPDTLDSVTNYEAYKGLYSSLVDINYFEIAYSLNREFGPDGLYRDLKLYNFVDNHDVDRVASKLKQAAWLYPLYLLMFTMPGIPSIYYGSEWGLADEKGPWSDASLRPALDLTKISANCPQPDLMGVIQKLAYVRQSLPALVSGNYGELLVDHQQLAFSRQFEGQTVVVALNSSSETVNISLSMDAENGNLRDLLDPGTSFSIVDRKAEIALPPTWGRILVLE